MSKIFSINKFHGGIADSLYSGISGSFAAGSYGVDIHTNPGVIQSQWKLTKDSGTTVVDLILFSFQGTDGNSYHFGDAGNIYKRTSGGSWSVVRTEAASARICGAIEYNGKFYWAISNKLYSMSTSGDWSTGITTEVTWTGSYIDTEWHPMIVAPTGKLFIGAGRYLSSVDDSGTFVQNALDLPPGWAIKALGVYQDYIIISASKTVGGYSAFFKYDGYGDTFITPTYLNVPTLDFIITVGNTILTGSGYTGQLYQYTLNDFLLVKRLPGTFTSSTYGKFYPSAVSYLNGVVVFGASTGDNTMPTQQGVYAFGSPNKNYPKVLSFDYPISSGNQTKVQIGALLVTSNAMYVSWKDTTSGTVYGVDKLDYTARQTTTVLQTPVIGGSGTELLFRRFIVNYEPLAASCSIQLKYKKNRGASFTAMTDSLAGTYSTASSTKVPFDQPIEAESLELQLTLTSSGTNTPIVRSIDIEYEPIGND